MKPLWGEMACLLRILNKIQAVWVGLSLYHIYVHPKEDGLAQIPLSSATPNNPIDYQFPRSTGCGPPQLYSMLFKKGVVHTS